MSQIDPNRVKNCNQCLSYFGPRQGHNGWGDSIALANPGLTPAQSLVDIDSIMSNRNVKQDRSKKGMVNMVDVFKFKTYDSTICDRALDPLSSITTFPKQLYREMSINRFYDLNLNPQVNIYYDWAVNSQLEAKDNYDYPYPFSITQDNTIPVANNKRVPPPKLENMNETTDQSSQNNKIDKWYSFEDGKILTSWLRDEYLKTVDDEDIGLQNKKKGNRSL